ncbi:MAG: hypothetical protein AMJ79_13745 [Phycisphaerae bacterium SM23_30]|nr:MAG: hypothetical protein AMJ79_13745 [Phycisphaerae bacterium SM23_30]
MWGQVITPPQQALMERIKTRWAQEVSPGDVWPEYPRPMMVRKDWLNLNGQWKFEILRREAEKPEDFKGVILVPFAPGSALSGIPWFVNPDRRLWYRKGFHVPDEWTGKRILLHFGGVDWETEVWLNGASIGTHQGGYDPFSFDITSALTDEPFQELILSVWDPTDEGPWPRGKQVLKPGGIFYSRVTGIWQTVWLEPVPAVSIKKIKTVADIDAGVLQLTAQGENTTGSDTIKADALEGGKVIATVSGPVGETLELEIGNPKLWSPDNPFLYDLKVYLIRQDKEIDQVGSYFGMRKISLGKDGGGTTRIFLNNKQIFSYGPLDQGWWPDGLYTAPTDEALRYDIEVIKKLGCNMMRKHVKIEPARFYYWCDKLGLMVWQDMASGKNTTAQAKKQFELELIRMIDNLQNHPSIVMWVPFNEGWGQFDTPRLVNLIKRHDPTRLVNNASGWTDRQVGDVHDVHAYPGPSMPPREPGRAAVLGEFGGLGRVIEGHIWQKDKNWGYRSYKTEEEQTNAYLELIDNLLPLIGGGLCGAVYTQTTDVEIEVNGLMTYDREIIKMDPDKLRGAHRKLYLPPPVIKPIVPTSQEAPQSWRYTTDKPADNWAQGDFDDSRWQRGAAGFGRGRTPGITINTQWTTSDIWMRRTFEMSKQEIYNPHLQIYHDEDAEVYLNGQLIAKVSDYTTFYVLIPQKERIFKALKLGTNVLAVHCHQTTGGQGIDAGIVDVITKDF